MEGAAERTMVESDLPIEDPIRIDLGHYQIHFSPRYIQTIADALVLGQICIVYLEPGDATRYAFYLIPQVGDYIDTYRFGDSINPWEENRVVWLSPINLDNTGGMMVFMGSRENIYHEIPNYSNPHTRTVMTIFLDLVWQSLEGIGLIPLNLFSPKDNEDEEVEGS